jgi:hypothetical protein
MHTITDFLLLEDAILEKYGLYMDSEDNKEEWLKSQVDSGELYYTLYEKVIDKKLINESLQLTEHLSVYLIDYIQTRLSPEDYLRFTSAVKYFEKGEPLKSKISKLTREMNVRDIEDLSSTYKIPINTFVYTKFSIKTPHKEMYTETKHELDDKLVKYKLHVSKLKDAKRFVENKTKYLVNEMEKYNSEVNLEKYTKYKRTIKKDSKYKGMNWSKLAVNDKHEVIIEYITNKYPERSKEISQFVIDAYNSKSIEYRSIKWVKEHGYIRDITGILIDPDTFECSVKKEDKQKTFIEANPGIVNEEMLYQVLAYNHSIENCISKLQNVFSIQKVSFSNSKKLTLLYNDIKNVIEDNPHF